MDKNGAAPSGSGSSGPGSSGSQPYAPSRARSALAIHLCEGMDDILAASANGTAQGTFMERMRAKHAAYQGNPAAQAAAEAKAAEEKLEKEAQAERYIQSKKGKKG